MQIDCNEQCKDKLNIVNKLIKNKKSKDEIQNANTDYHICINACNLRKHDRNRDTGGGNRKKYIGKTKNSRSRTRRRIHRSRTNYRKKTARR